VRKFSYNYITYNLLNKIDKNPLRIANKLNLKGEYVNLGNKEDIFYEESYQDNIELDILFSYGSLKISFDKSLTFTTKYTMKKPYQFTPDFQYISTDRIPPYNVYGLSGSHIEQNLIGNSGEYTAHYLAKNPHKKLDIEQLKHPKAITNHLLENVSLWLSEISQGVNVRANLNEALQQAIITYNYIYGENRTNDYSPLNVGFGLTYVLPIIVAILKAKPDDLLIIENPESHLHPAGQSKIAKLCALAVANGVQIIVESHSDHFLNAIRVATKQGILKAEDSVVYYFSKTSDSMETKVEEININANGSIDAYPKGFFDQFDDDLDALIEW